MIPSRLFYQMHLSLFVQNVVNPKDDRKKGDRWEEKKSIIIIIIITIVMFLSFTSFYNSLFLIN